MRKNLDEVQTTWKRYIKNQRSLETTWMNKKQLRRASRLSQTLSSGARHSLQLRPGARIQGWKTKNTSTQDYNKDNTSRPFIRFLYERKELGEGSGAAGYITPEFFEDKNLDPPLLQAKARGSGATLSECNFYEKLHHRKRTQSNQED